MSTNSTVLVAIPSEDDYVWRLSSEKVPHMTLLYFDDLSNNPNLEHILGFVEHVANINKKFWMGIDHRGPLGPDEADVLFFEKNNMTKRLLDLRSNLLGNTDLFTAYSSVEQYSEWTPHLTMGYPATPAKEDPRDYPGINGVNFDRIALWTSDYEGPTFNLKSYEETEVFMSTAVDLVLAHHGIKGQKWGVRRKNGGGSAPKVPTEVMLKARPGGFVQSTGGKHLPPSTDALNAQTHRQKARSSTTDSLSNTDLQALVTRMNLEQQYSKLSKTNDRSGRAARFIKSILNPKNIETAKKVQAFANSEQGKALKTKLKPVKVA